MILQCFGRVSWIQWTLNKSKVIFPWLHDHAMGFIVTDLGHTIRQNDLALEMLAVLPEYCVWRPQKLQFQLGQHLISAAVSFGALVRIAEFLILGKNLSQNLVFQSPALQKDFLKTSISTYQRSGPADLKKLKFLSPESHTMCLESSHLSGQAGGEKNEFLLMAEVT